jgi:hypothetical protein
MSILDPTANFTGRFRFFDLPREIRDQVYHECWPLTANLQHHMRKEGKRQLQLGICHDIEEGIQKYYNTYPEWLRVNSQFVTEAMQQLYRGSRVWGQVPGSSLTTNFWFGRTVDAEDFREEVDNDLTELLHGEPLLPGYIPEEDYSSTAIGVIKTWPTDLHLLKKMELAFVDGDTKKKELCITFAIAGDRLKGNTVVDLSAFAKTGLEVDTLVVEVLGIGEEESDNAPCRNYAQYADRLQMSMGEEVEKLGRVLVGEGCGMVFAEGVDERLAYDVYWRFEVTKG